MIEFEWIEEAFCYKSLSLYYKFLIFASGAIFTVNAGSSFIGLVVKPFLDQIEKAKRAAGAAASKSLDLMSRGFENGGRVIGQLERALIFLFIMVNHPSLIGFLIAAKSILRFGEMKDKENRMEAEYIIIGTFVLFTIVACIPASEAAGPPESRYFYSGDGTIDISNEKNRKSFKGTYRTQDGSYDEKALKKIYSVFGARYGEPVSEISPRLVEFLDFIADSLRPEGQIEIISGWRSPEYNRKLKQKGRLAAKASLHQYGMAADLKIKGVPSKHIWNYVKELGYGGAGYYHGDLVHIDVGPPRFWDEKTSGVDTGISDDNKLIGLVTDRDIYLPGETLTLRFIRMTAFPIGVSPEFILEQVEKDGEAKKIATFKPLFSIEAGSLCPQFHNIGHMLGITWKLPQGLQAGHYQIRSSFCEKQWENMPQDITTPKFEIFTP